MEDKEIKHIKLLLIFSIILFLSLFLIDSIRATDFNKAQTSKSGIVDMMEVLPEYLQVNSTAENRDFHIKRNERALGTGTQYYFYMEGGTLTVSITTDGILKIGTATIGVSNSNVGIGTITPSTALQVIGTVTANNFSGNGAGLTNINPVFTSPTTITPSLTVTGSSTSSADTSFAVKDSISTSLFSVTNSGVVNLGNVIITDKTISVVGNNQLILSDDGIAITATGNNGVKILSASVGVAIGTTTHNGTLNIGGTLKTSGTITATALSVSPAVTIPTYVNGTTTVTWANTIQLQTANLTLSGATCTVTFTGGGTGTNHCLFVNQDATGTRTVTWNTAIIKFPGGTTPVLTATASAKDILQFKCLDGVNYYCTGFASDVK